MPAMCRRQPDHVVQKIEEQIALLREEERKYAAESGEDVQQHKQVRLFVAALTHYFDRIA